MIKADAYGHGIKIIFNILKNYCNYFGVANLKEALYVRKLSETSKIIIVGKSIDFKKLIENNISFTIDSVNEIIEVFNICNQIKKRAHIHIAINTGMNRIGVDSIKTFKNILIIIEKSKYVILEGVFTHCYDADFNKNSFQKQMAVFYNYVKLVENYNILVHIGGSYTLLNKIPKFINMVRVGYFIYGYGMPSLKPVMAIRSKVIEIRNVKKGECVGYGKNYLKKDIKLATIPVGYADGIPRNVSNKYNVIINGTNCKIVGKICMDMFMVDITNVKCNLNDTVELFYNANKLAHCANTSTYEILTNFQKLRAKRLIVE